MTMDVVEATNSCLLATAEECFIMRLSDDVSERQILEEYGRCLEQVIDAANRSSGTTLFFYWGISCFSQWNGVSVAETREDC